MNAHQMVCHCTDQIRMALGTKKAEEDNTVNLREILLLARSGKMVPTPKGFGQVEGEGTIPSDFNNDKSVLKQHIIEFSEAKDSYDFALHPYFGKLDKEGWSEITNYHLNHHLKQFGV